MNKQLIKDFSRILNNHALGFCDVRPSKALGGISIGRLSLPMQNGSGYFNVTDSRLNITYGTLISSVISVKNELHDNSISDTLYSLNYDTASNKYSLATTECSNLELFGVRHTRISVELGRTLLKACEYGREVDVISHDSTGHIHIGNRCGQYLFTLDHE